MADQVLKGGLILTDWADNMAKVDAARFANIQRQQQQEEYARQSGIQQASDQAFQQYARGDVKGAMNTAAAGNAQSLWENLGKEQKAQVGAQVKDIADGVAPLLGMNDVAQRAGYYDQVMVPLLRTHGADEATIGGYRARLADNDFLSGVHKQALGFKDLWTQENKVNDAATAQRYDLEKLGAGLTTSTDGSIIRNGTGETVHAAGLAPKLIEYKDENGATHLYPFAGQSGAGGDASRVMNYEARGAGVGSVPDSVQTLGQFSDFASGLNRQGIKSSAAGTYQIVGATMRQYAPKVLGSDWRNQPFNAATQDRVAEAIFNDNRGSASALRSQWVSLSQADAERVRNMPWSQARQFIAAGESGGSVQQGGVRSATAGDINLGGGRTGPLWKDETRQIGGQNVVGQRNQQTGEFKPLGGAAAKASKPVDYDGQISNADNSLATIDRALKHPGLNAAFGMPSINPLDGNLFGKIVPGSPAADALALVDTVKSQAFLAGVSQMKGQGALSDAEGAKISTAIANLSGSQSDAQIRENLGVIRNMVATGRNRMVQQRNRGGGQQGQAETRTVNGRTYVKVQGGWKAQ